MPRSRLSGRHQLVTRTQRAGVAAVLPSVAAAATAPDGAGDAARSIDPSTNDRLALQSHRGQWRALLAAG